MLCCGILDVVMSEGRSRVLPISLDAATRAAIEAVPYQRTPNYAGPTVHPWRRWHHAHYGGSPIPVRLAPALGFSHTRLYLGPSRVDLGDVMHPDVECIVNLCQINDTWALLPDDRRWPRGEGLFGYTWQTLDADARELAELIRSGRRVLIHCMAGVNRSSTLTCAVLMHLEGISAEAALRRVQRFHQPAYPEELHWQALRRLDIALRAEHQGQTGMSVPR
jgi:hypothetical protein